MEHIYIKKIIFQRLLLFALSLFILYPLLHELGHALAAWIFGGKVVRITIYPAFYTECYIRPDQLGCYIVTAVSGILFPLLCSLAIPPERERGFIVSLSLRIMSLAYAAGEMVGVTRCILGRGAGTSDLCVLIRETAIDPYASLVLAGLLFILSLLLLVSLEPLERIVKMVAPDRSSSVRGRSFSSERVTKTAQ